MSTPEFRLLSECAFLDVANWPIQRDAVVTLLRGGINPKAFVKLVRRHRLPVLAHTVLQRASDEAGLQVPWVREVLLPIARTTRARNLALHAEWRRIEDLLATARIPVNALKGTTLSERLYGDATMRHTRDIDMIVAAEDVTRSAEVLEEAGYSVEHILLPELRHGLPLRLCRALQWHINCEHAQKKVTVELHSRFERIFRSDLNARWKELMRGSATGPLPSAYFDLLYCSLHGASHGWMRLKWLGDVRVLAASLKPHDWPALLGLARELRMETVLAQTLILLKWVFDFPLPQHAQGLVKVQQKAASKLSEEALEWLSYPEEELREDAVAQKVRSERRQWRLHHRYHLHERALYWIAAALFSPADMSRFRLPGWLFPMYPVIGPFSTVGRAVLHAARRMA